MKCPRCLNQDPSLFGNKNGIYYCRKCIKYPTKNYNTIPIVKKNKVDYQLAFNLTPQQQLVSNQLVQRFLNGQNSIVKAVCGAGKTEITYQLLKLALNKQLRVCFTMPRRALVVETARRIAACFKQVNLAVVYGGHSDYLKGQLVVCTVHQLYRYENCFDLLILDESDAFPYAGDEVLQSILAKSIRGCYVMMSATLQDNYQLALTKRFHGHKIPEPVCHQYSNLMTIIAVGLKVTKYRRQGKPWLLFVASKDQTKTVAKKLKLLRLRVMAISSQTTDIHHYLDLLRAGKLDGLVTTTVLERGITIPNIQVIVVGSENRVFSTSTLIQIAGRVGRKVDYPSGEVTFYCTKRTQAIKQCLGTIKQDNA